MTLAELLSGFRKSRGLSQRALSLAAGLSESYVSKLEAGTIEPSLVAFLRIARALRLSEKEVGFCVRISMLNACGVFDL